MPHPRHPFLLFSSSLFVTWALLVTSVTFAIFVQSFICLSFLLALVLAKFFYFTKICTSLVGLLVGLVLEAGSLSPMQWEAWQVNEEPMI